MSEVIETTGLAKYDAMQRAIVAAVAVDEVKDIRDKALALEKYAQQARNIEAEKRAASIRIRAEMKGAELYRESEKAKAIDKGDKRKGKGGKVMRCPRDTASAPQPKTLEQLGISKKQSSNWQKLASNPKAVEKYLDETDDVPTTAGAIAAATGKPVVIHPPRKDPPKLDFSENSLWFKSRLADIDGRGLKPKRIVEGCNPRMRKELVALLDRLIPVLKEIRETL